MYKRTIPPKIQQIQQPQFNQQKMVLNGGQRRMSNHQNEAIQSNVNESVMQNGNGIDNPFMSKVGRRRREENTPPSNPVNPVNFIHEINAKRERIIQEQMKKMQAESQMMMERYMDDAKRREDLLKNEMNMRTKEESTKQNLLKERMDEAEARAKARKDELQRQESLIRGDALNQEMVALRRREEAARLEEQKKLMLKSKETQEERDKQKAKLQAEIRERELQRAEERKVEEMLRQKELDRIQNEIRREQMQIQYNNSRKNSISGHNTTSTNGNMQGYGSAKTGIVSRRKLALLTRSNSVGPPSDEVDVPTNNYMQSKSTHATPKVTRRNFTMPVTMPSTQSVSNDYAQQQRPIGRIQDMDDRSHESAQYENEYNAHCEVTTNTNQQWSMLAQQTAAIANTDFANQTQALSSGLSRPQK